MSQRVRAMERERSGHLELIIRRNGKVRSRNNNNSSLGIGLESERSTEIRALRKTVDMFMMDFEASKKSGDKNKTERGRAPEATKKSGDKNKAERSGASEAKKLMAADTSKMIGAIGGLIDIDHDLKKISPPKLVMAYNTDTHPLLIDLVIENVVKHMDYDTLKNSRLACTKWNSHIAPVFREQAKMVVKLDIVDRPLIEFEGIFTTETLETPEYERYKAFEVEMPIHLKYVTKRDWLKDYGKSLTYFKIGRTWADPDEVDHEMMFPRSTDIRLVLRERCPNLKSFVIPVPFLELDADICSIPLEERRVNLDLLEIGMNHDFDLIDPEFGELLEEIFSSIAGVKTLKLISVHNCKGFSRLLVQIKEKPENVVLENISSLDLLEYRMGANCLDLMSGANFANLKVLSLGRLNDLQPRDMPNLCKLLKQLRNTLEELNLGVRSDNRYENFSNRCVLVFPKLTNLKIFRNYSITEWIINSLDFMLMLPNLVELELKDSLLPTLPPSSPDQVFLCNSLRKRPHRSLKRFCVRNVTADYDSIQTLLHCFPNLDHLQFSNKSPTAVYQSIEKLTGLRKTQIRLHLQSEPRDYAVVFRPPNSAGQVVNVSLNYEPGKTKPKSSNDGDRGPERLCCLFRKWGLAY